MASFLLFASLLPDYDNFHLKAGYMINRYLLIQIITFIAAVVVFDLWERKRPGVAINKNKGLALNIAAMLVVIFAGEHVKKIVAMGYGAADLSSVLAGNWLSYLPGAPKMFLAVLLSDFCLYWVHRAMHGPLKLLWNAHAFHHTIGELWWLSGSRTSIVHLFFFALPQVLIGYFLLRLTIGEATAVLCFSTVVNLWLHINVWVDIGPLERILITPNYHRLHHGAKGLMQKNLGFIFTMWDRMFGTYASPRIVGKNVEVFQVALPLRPAGLVRTMLGI
jgi:sterol desaturase/sphingolipid hydroxylase (fatty acid hydroxylase superfamily)